jgi:hypothetical protein
MKITRYVAFSVMATVGTVLTVFLLQRPNCYASDEIGKTGAG